MLSEVAPVSIAAVGDVFPGDHYFSLGHGLMSRTEQGTLESLFTDVSPTLRDSDIALCNLEGPLSRTSDQTSVVQAEAFRGLPEYCRLLKQAGFTHINVANNHILQHGSAAFDETLDILKEHGLLAVGLAGVKEGRISQPVVTRIRNRSVCVLGYSGVKERRSVQPIGYAYFEDHVPVVSEIASLSREFDEVVVSCHAGEEGLRFPSPQQVSMYRRFIDAGARCVLGHHSHVFQPVERHGEGVIAYSLGNFVFDLFWDSDTISSAILKLQMSSQNIDWDLVVTTFSSSYRIKQLSTTESAAFEAALRDAADRMKTLSEVEYLAAARLSEARGQRAKYMYFVRNVLRGHTSRKLRFLGEKILGH